MALLNYARLSERREGGEDFQPRGRLHKMSAKLSEFWTSSPTLLVTVTLTQLIITLVCSWGSPLGPLPLPVQTSYVHAPEALDDWGSAVEVSNLDSSGSKLPRLNPTLAQFLRKYGFDCSVEHINCDSERDELKK